MKGPSISVLLWLIALGLPAVSVHGKPPPPCTAPVVKATTGEVCGAVETVPLDGRNREVDVYQGIRYGIADRWKDSRPVHAPGLTQATVFGDICPQNVAGTPVGEEDCLFLNVWTPADTKGRELPVMVFIHGGAFAAGTGGGELFPGALFNPYDGGQLAARGDVVVVTFNYRLGALGFLGGGTGKDKLRGNYGFKDQILALRWVHHNIARFGGDRKRVTIFGESAGGISVGAHLISDQSRGLFMAAIMESNPYGLPLQTPTKTALIREIFNDAAHCSRADSLECLRGKTAAEIVMAQASGDFLKAFSASVISLKDLVLPWSPTLDRGILKTQPVQATLPLPTIAGTNRDEGPLFVYPLVDAILMKGPDQALPPLIYFGIVKKLFGGKTTEILSLTRYTPDPDDNRPQLSSVVGDYLFTCPNRLVLSHAQPGVPVWGYQFAQLPSFPPMLGLNPPGACNPLDPSQPPYVCHTFELPFVFHNGPLGPPFPATASNDDKALSLQMVDWWTNFATSFEPAPASVWPPFVGPDGDRLVIENPPPTPPLTADEEANCSLWDSIGYGP